MTSEQHDLVKRLSDIVAEQGPGVTVHRFCRLAGVSDRRIYAAFPGGYGELRVAAGLEPRVRIPKRFDDESLLDSFAALAVRISGRLPTWREVDRFCVASAVTYQKRFGTLRGTATAALVRLKRFHDEAVAAGGGPQSCERTSTAGCEG